MHFLWSTLLIFTLSSSATSIWINVPFVRQQEEGCGAASISMLMEYWKIHGHSMEENATDPIRIMQLLYSKKNHGILVPDLTNYLRDHEFTTFEFNGKWDDLVHHISKGRPLIASLEANSRKDRLHYLLVTGVDTKQNLVLVNDPSERKLLKMKRSTFEGRWVASGNWTLLAIPKGSAGLSRHSGTQASTGPPAFSEPEYDSAISEAKKGNYEAAKLLLESGWNRSKNDQFLPELAGIHYRLGDREQAKRYLFQILKIDPDDRYANHFLGTLFLLDGNLEACLKYWNRIGQPVIEEIEMRPVPRIDPEILDHAFVMAPASQLKLEEYLATESRFETMDTFRRYQFKLRPYKEEEKFDLVLEPSVKKNSLSSKIKIAGLAGQAIFTETIKPEFNNIGGTTISSKSLISWDEYKNRFHTSLSLPFGDKPHQRIRMFGDVRRETWALESDLDLNRWEAGLEFSESLNSKFIWSGGTTLSFRNYTEASADAFSQGWATDVFGTVDYSLLRIPEKRMELNSISHAELGKFFGSSSFVTLSESLEFHWLPKATGNDLAMNARFSAGKIFGAAPFDEYFVLGVERDSNLLLRAHKSSIDQKGENPFSPAYLLWNWDISKIVMEKKFVRWRIAPFF